MKNGYDKENIDYKRIKYKFKDGISYIIKESIIRRKKFQFIIIVF